MSGDVVFRAFFKDVKFEVNLSEMLGLEDCYLQVLQLPSIFT